MCKLLVRQQGWIAEFFLHHAPCWGSPNTKASLLLVKVESIVVVYLGCDSAALLEFTLCPKKGEEVCQGLAS